MATKTKPKPPPPISRYEFRLTPDKRLELARTLGYCDEKQPAELETSAELPGILDEINEMLERALLREIKIETGPLKPNLREELREVACAANALAQNATLIRDLCTSKGLSVEARIGLGDLVPTEAHRRHLTCLSTKMRALAEHATELAGRLGKEKPSGGGERRKKLRESREQGTAELRAAFNEYRKPGSHSADRDAFDDLCKGILKAAMSESHT